MQTIKIRKLFIKLVRVSISFLIEESPIKDFSST